MERRFPSVLEELLCLLQLDGWTAAVTDEAGVKLNPGPLTFLDFLIQDKRLWAYPLDQWLKKIDRLNRSLTLDMDLAGIAVRVAPILSEQTTVYVWTSEGLETDAKNTLLAFAEAHYGSADPWLEVIRAAPEPFSPGLEKVQSKLEQWMRLASSLLRGSPGGSPPNLPPLFLEAAELGRRGDFALVPFLNLLLQDAADACFGGVVKEAEEEGTYRIAETANPRHPAMAGAEFRIGEGFLGQAVMVGDVLSWKDIAHDPRSQFFSAFGIEPRSLFCVPVANDRHHVSGLIFWGSCSRDREAPAVTPAVQALAELYGICQSVWNLDKAYQKQKIYLSSLIEITKLIHRIQDLKKLLAVLVDISINLVEDARSSLFIFRVPGKNKVSIVSRGMTQEQTQRYARDLISRYFDTPGPADQPYLGETSWGEISLECPISCYGTVQGAICVFLPRNRGLKDYMDVFQAFMTLADLAIERALNRDADREQDRSVTLLYASMGQWNEEKRKLHAEARELAAGFASTALAETEAASLISSACLVCAYPADFLKTHLEQQAGLVDLVAEFQTYRTGTRNPDVPLSAACQVMALAFAYLEQRDRPDALYRLEAISAPMREAFIRFVSSRLTAEFETELERKPDAALHLADLTQTFKLSSRELEVYELVVKGLGNKEIAETLFISEHTVKNHITNLFQKLNVSDRAHAIALAYRSSYN